MGPGCVRKTIFILRERTSSVSKGELCGSIELKVLAMRYAREMVIVEHSLSGWMVSQAGQIRTMLLHRPFRVVALALAIAVMSGADLYLTLLYVTHTGMNELNPLARAMMDYQSPAILALWKAGTVVISIGILILIRKQRSAEFGAWIGCLVMGSLMFHWQGYIETSNALNIEMAQAQNQHNSSWIMMSTGADGIDQSVSWIID
jgi:Domain of unknown function (DUF5658)